MHVFVFLFESLSVLDKLVCTKPRTGFSFNFRDLEAISEIILGSGEALMDKKATQRPQESHQERER